MPFSLCGQVAANTGIIDCDTRRGTPQQIILGSGIFAPSDYSVQATFKAAFLTLIKKANTDSAKLFPLPIIQGNTDKTVAAKEGNLGYGLRVVLLRSKAGYEFDMLVGSSLEKKLMKFNNKTIPAYIFDDASNIWGVLDSSLNFKGSNYLVTVEPQPFGDGQNVKTTKVSLSLIDSKDFTENSAFASTDFSTNDLVGLVDAYLYQTAAPAANVYHIGLKVKTDEIKSFINVHDNAAFVTALANSARWVAKTGATFGTTLAITSVVDDPTNGGWTITFDSTAFSALASLAQIQLNLAAPSVLDAAGVTGVEGNYMIITKP